MARKRQTTQESISFEDSLEKLRAVIREIESGELTLDDSLRAYEQGVKHLRDCHARLERVEQKLRLLVDVDESGVAKTKDFQHAASSFLDEGDDDEEAEDEY